MFELSGVNYEEVLEQGDSILVRVIGGSNYRNYTVPVSEYKNISFEEIHWFSEIYTCFGIQKYPVN